MIMEANGRQIRGGPGCILAIDQGTTGTTALLISQRGEVLGRGYRQITQIYPKPGWVEHSPEEIWEKSLEAIHEARKAAGRVEIAAIGIANQRETTIIWDSQTGSSVHPAIVWQCRRTAALCEDLKNKGLAPWIARKTGLLIDAYFSATKIQWLLANVSGLRERAEKGEVRFGTVDTWLLDRLTGGEIHATDYSNASRTLVYNIRDLEWDREILNRLDIPSSLLPEVRPSSGVFGQTKAHSIDTPEGRVEVIPPGIPIAGIAGDQMSALFGQACFSPGMLKVTYGTGAFLLLHTGDRPVFSERGLLTTIAWGLPEPDAGKVRVEYALEGSLFVAGAAIQWLRDELGLLKNAADSEALATSIQNTGGVYFVPAFVGLGAPHWDMYARGAIVGLTRGSGRAEIVRAALESIAYQTRDVVDLMTETARANGLDGLAETRIDGGAAQNNFLAQFQSDILQAPVVRPRITETTALGAAYLAGLAVGLWKSRDEISQLWETDRRFEPTLPENSSEALYRDWLRAVDKSRGWIRK